MITVPGPAVKYDKHKLSLTGTLNLSSYSELPPPLPDSTTKLLVKGVGTVAVAAILNSDLENKVYTTSDLDGLDKAATGDWR